MNHRLKLSRRLLFVLTMMLLLCADAMETLHAQERFFKIGTNTIDIASFNRQVEETMQETGVPGLSLAVIDHNRIAFYNAYGHKQFSKPGKVSGKTVFEACSLSKSFLVFIAYQLADEGKLDLDKPLFKYLRFEPLEHDERYKQITARMVLSHASGIENYRPEHDPDTLEIVSDPGKNYVYSGEGYNYLAAVVEHILNAPYSSYVRDRIIQPLNLQNTFTAWSADGKYPADYATGHNFLEEEIEKWKNDDAQPAGGNHVTAEDYAKLIIAFFNKKNLSDKRMGDLLQPVINIRHSVYYGPGFEIFYNGSDTIIAHSGNNPGFKAQLMYSVVHRKGFVYFSNSDRGDVIVRKLNQLTVALDIDSYFKADFYTQYPSMANHLLKIYRQSGAGDMYSEMEKLKQEQKLDSNTLNELGDVFIYVNNEVAEKMLTESVSLFPSCAVSHYLLGMVYMAVKDYHKAYVHLSRAKELHFDAWQLDLALQECVNMIKEEEQRLHYLVAIDPHKETTIQAEDYNRMSGVMTGITIDSAGGRDVGYIDTGDWMDYEVNILKGGSYMIEWRVASQPGGARIHCYSNTTLIDSVAVPSTNGWQSWTTLRSKVQLSPGRRKLRIYAATGGFNFNWMRFSPMVRNSF